MSSTAWLACQKSTFVPFPSFRCVRLGLSKLGGEYRKNACSEKFTNRTRCSAERAGSASSQNSSLLVTNERFSDFGKGVIVNESTPFSRSELLNILEGSGFQAEVLFNSELESGVLTSAGIPLQLDGSYLFVTDREISEDQLLKRLNSQGFGGYAVNLKFRTLKRDNSSNELQTSQGQISPQISTDINHSGGGFLKKWGGLIVLSFIAVILWEAWKIYTREEQEKKSKQKENEKLGRIRLRKVESMVKQLDQEEEMLAKSGLLLTKKILFNDLEEREIYEQAWEVRQIQRQAKLIIAKEKQEIEEYEESEQEEDDKEEKTSVLAVENMEGDEHTTSETGELSPQNNGSFFVDSIETKTDAEQDSSWKEMEAEIREALEKENAEKESANDAETVEKPAENGSSHQFVKKTVGKLTVFRQPGQEDVKNLPGSERKTSPEANGTKSKAAESVSIPMEPKTERKTGRVRIVRAKDLAMNADRPKPDPEPKEQRSILEFSEEDKAILSAVAKNGATIDWAAFKKAVGEERGEFESKLYEGVDMAKAKVLFERLVEIDKIGKRGVERLYENPAWEGGAIFRDDPIENYRPKLRDSPREKDEQEILEDLAVKERLEEKMGIKKIADPRKFTAALPQILKGVPGERELGGAQEGAEPGWSQAGDRLAPVEQKTGEGKWSNTKKWAEEIWSENRSPAPYVESISAVTREGEDLVGGQGGAPRKPKKWSKEFQRQYDEETDPEVRAMMKEMGADLPEWVSEEELEELRGQLVSPTEVDRLAEQYWDKLRARKRKELEKVSQGKGGGEELDLDLDEGEGQVQTEDDEEPEETSADVAKEDWWRKTREAVVISFGDPSLDSTSLHTVNVERAQEAAEGTELPPSSTYVVAFENGKDAYIYGQALQRDPKLGTLNPQPSLLPSQDLDEQARRRGWEVLLLRKGQLEFKSKQKQTFSELFQQVMAKAREESAEKEGRESGLDIIDFIEERAQQAAQEEIDREKGSQE